MYRLTSITILLLAQLSVLLALGFRTRDAGACTRSYERLCSNGNCIYEWKLCNLKDDCGDGSDEKDCTCLSEDGKFKCGNGKCIWMWDTCNTEDDCGDNSDETASFCEMAYCDNGEPVHIDHLCDGFEQCDDGSDEWESLCTMPLI
ncbi:suppressor of tumorigenicity 14 protein homolog [Ptychodera flava]|uniref:suppressor of tumorigenicity 14 protein homolog n=1 Tax=Ptychodera flava TaxID=63121 RepID=UPI00396A2080